MASGLFTPGMGLNDIHWEDDPVTSDAFPIQKSGGFSAAEIL